MISIVSIPHTGTQFTQKILLGMGYEVRCAHVHSEHPDQNAWRWIKEGGLVVIPWRDPELANISALNRGQERRPMSEFVQALAWSTYPNVHLFEVEPKDRDMELARLRAFLGSEKAPQTDWAPVNTSLDTTGLKAAHMESCNV